MLSVIYKSDTTAVGDGNPLPVICGYSDTLSFNAAISTTNAASAPVLIKSLTSGKSIYITDVVISTQQAGAVWLADSDGTVVMEKVYLAANGQFVKTFSTPLKVTASKALMLKSSVAINASTTISGIVR